MKNIKRSLKNLFFPNYCVICGKEGKILCDDCFSLIDINPYLFCHVCHKRIPRFRICEKCQRKSNLSALFFASFYQDKIVKEIIQKFKYPPFLKELSVPLAQLIIAHLTLLEFQFPQNSIFVPIPLSKKREKWRGFNQAKEIGKKLSEFYNIPLKDNILFKKRDTLPQAELNSEERKENIKASFFIKNSEQIKGKVVFLIDDVSTTGSTLEEAALTLKEGKPKEVFAIVVAKE